MAIVTFNLHFIQMESVRIYSLSFCVHMLYWVGQFYTMFPKVSFTKLCDASYNQLTHRRSDLLILLTNYYIALGCVAHALHRVTLRYAARHELRWYEKSRRTNSTYEHLCERPPGYITSLKKNFLRSIHTSLHLHCSAGIAVSTSTTTLQYCNKIKFIST